MVKVLGLVIFFGLLAAGLFFGALNGHTVLFDYHLGQVSWPLATLLALALLCGLVLGLLLAWLFVVLPLKVRLGRARRQVQALTSVTRGTD